MTRRQPAETPPTGLDQAAAAGDAARLRIDVKHTNRGVVVQPTYNNGLIWMSTEEELRNLFQYNEFFSRNEISRMPPWGGELGAYPKPVEDTDILALKAWLIERFRVEFQKTVLNEVVDHESQCNKYDPVKNYLTSLKWDGVERLKTWLFDYLAVEKGEYESFVGQMTLAAACHRVDKPGVKYDYMLILEGDQGIGKSMAVKVLGGEWYREISMSDRDKDTVEKMQGAWLIEVAEMAVFKKREIESLKAFITCAEDTQRLPYGYRSKLFRRRNIFIGTINPDNNGYLTDSTGNRRFLPIHCRDHIDLTGLAKVRDQLWAEAWQLYQKGFPMYIPAKGVIAEEANARQVLRQTTDEWQDLIAHYLMGKDKVRGIDIWTECIKGFSSDFDRFRQVRIADCMTKLGWEKGVYRFEGKQSNGYHRIDPEMSLDNDSTPWKE